MKAFTAVRSTFLASALVLTSLPGCQGADTPDTGPEEEFQSTAQGLTCSSAVTAMTGPTTPAGSVTRSGVYSAAYEAWQAFDANSASLWISAVNQTPAWLAYQVPAGTAAVHRYALAFANGPSLTTRAPKDWTFQGWNGSAWVVLDTRTNQTGWGGFERREFTLSAPASYSQYRLHVTDDNDTRAGVVVISLNRLELITCVNDGITNPVTALWTRTSGAVGTPVRVHDLVGDPAGRSYITGFTTGGLDGNPMIGGMDAFLHARDWNGDRIWSVQLGAPDSIALGYGIATNRTWEEIYVGGFTDGSMHGTPRVGSRDAFVTKYRYTGVRQWTRQQGVAGTSTEGYDVAVDTADNAFLVGTATGGLDGNTRTGDKDVFVTKYDAAGTRQWTRQMGAAGQNTVGRRAATDAAGNVYVSGWTYGGLDGNTRQGVQDAFVIKYDSAGVKQWTRQLGSSGNNVWLYGSTTDAAGNVYLTGQSGGGLDGNPNPTPGSDAYLAKYDPSGNRLWTREFSAANGIWASGIFIDETGIYVSGGAQGDVGNLTNTTVLKGHNYVAKFDTAGNRLWVVQQNPAVSPAGGPAPVYSNGVNREFNGSLYLGGYTEGNFGGNTLVGTYDAFVTKLAAP
ncbi:hypothetical protein D7Y13_00550 [Corallococcus praedator]|uniref:F5/8 type C domain-containing protein n=1 Tax=Corallococcus praedator TaxID=2316724 RepID=A0ABX9QSB7_9BACT|nr:MULTISPECIES: SBBP repeat-containing protein [Corallococcus]RKH35919.1 hypothetical protein D7X75_02610 [Corallococcus sp. CA031C]RKI17617.1 hypothetical protein D7Y13_00550 [Corallococcus praedator]